MEDDEGSASGRRWRVPPDQAATPAPAGRLPPRHHLLLVGAGGAVGGLARVALAAVFPTDVRAFPWTTMLENVAGAFALAVVLTWLAERVAASTQVRLLVCTGALGAFTTYSTLAVEVTERVLERHVLLGMVYAASSVACGLAAAIGGIALTRRVRRAGAGR